MRRPLLWFVLLLAPLAAGATGATAAEPEVQAAIAEYERASYEMHRLANRNAWKGVERFYERCVETGADLTAQDHLAGAHAASARGDIDETRERLMKAHKLEESRSTIEWLYRIDQSYGTVVLEDERKRRPDLAIRRAPFMPDAQAAVARAVEQLASEGRFEGRLPVGAYTYGDIEFTVEAGETVEHAIEDPRRR